MSTTGIIPQLPRSYPEAQGIRSTAIIDFLNRINEKNLGLNSFMLLRHGSVVAEGWWAPYKAELPHMLFSLSKSFTSTAVGMAVSEQLLSLEDKVISFFPEDVPESPDSNLAQMNISHLLMMGTGHTEDTMMNMLQAADGNYVRAFLQLPVEREPGTHFLYNTGATYMLSAIVQKVTGQTLLEFLAPRLFIPLGIANPTWQSCPRGINVGGYGLSVTTEDIAKFGQLYLQQGQWNGRQVLPAEWVAAATSKQIENGDSLPESGEWSQGYGYQFWRCRHGAYRGDGAFGQFCIVLPEQDAVVAMTSGTNDMQQIMDAVWELLLPAMESGPELEQTAETAELAEQLGRLQIEPQRLIRQSSLEADLNGQLYLLEGNELKIEALSLSFDGDEAIFSLHGAYGGQNVKLGRGEWAASSAKITDGPQEQESLMSSFTWVTEDKLRLSLLLVETPFCFDVDITVKDKAIELTQSANVSMGPAEESVTIQGRAQQ